MKRFVISALAFVSIVLSVFAGGDDGCGDLQTVQQSFTSDTGEIRIWGDDYQGCKKYVCDINVNKQCYLKITYQIDLCTIAALDDIYVFTVTNEGKNSSGLIYYHYSPIQGVVFTTLPSGRARVVLTSYYGNYDNLAKGVIIKYETCELPKELYLNNLRIKNNLYLNDTTTVKAVNNNVTFTTGSKSWSVGYSNSNEPVFSTTQPFFRFAKPIYFNGSGYLGTYSGGTYLHLCTFNKERLTINPAGMVGIGTKYPSTLLHVVGGTLKIGLSTTAEDRQTNLLSFGDGNYIQIGEWEVNNKLSFKANSYNFTNGNVGINTTDPRGRLDVNGELFADTINTTALFVNSVDGADYVFDGDYQLPALEEVEEFIQTNKHLPDIPSADYMKTNGINVVDFQILLLQKIEELTLQLIDQQKTIQDLQLQIDELKK